MNNPATLADLQTQLHTLYASDTSQPVFGDLDYTVRTGYLNAAIHKWETMDGMLWKELFTTDSSLATNGVLTQFSTPANFHHLTGGVQVLLSSGSYIDYQVISPQEANRHDNPETTIYIYLTGTPGAYKINSTQPLPTGTLVYPYYKMPTELAATTDVTEVPDPYYLIYSALADLLLFDDNYYGFNTAGGQADTQLQAMKVRNEASSYFQANAVPNLTTYGWGE